MGSKSTTPVRAATHLRDAQEMVAAFDALILICEILMTAGA